MEYVLTASEMKKCDETAINEYGIESLVLMERAAYETAKAIIDKYGKNIYVGIMAGSGNNGGDGIAVARILQEAGIRVEINLIGDERKLTTETRKQLEIAKKLDIQINYGVEHTLYDVIVDAIFGIGLTRNIEGKYKSAIEMINTSHAAIVACDIPSGINSDNGTIMGCAVKADVTVTYEYRKLGIMLYPGAEYAGDIKCVSIGIPKAVVKAKRTGIVTFMDKEMDLNLPDRNPSGNKGTFGKLLMIAGSKNMGGACILSALSAYRIGAGMVRLFTAEENRESILRRMPEAIINTYNDNGDIFSEEEERTLIESIKWASVIAIGPGLSITDKARRMLELVIENNQNPLVIDADALNLLSMNEDILRRFEFGRRTNDYDIIFTPHLGELSRLIRYPVTEIKKDVLGICKKFTKKYDVTLVCKDSRTFVVKRGKFTYLNSSGNEGMATAGSGDVLTGIIAGLIAQNQSGFEAAVMGTYIHGLAGDMVKLNSSSHFVMAQDIIHALKSI